MIIMLKQNGYMVQKKRVSDNIIWLSELIKMATSEWVCNLGAVYFLFYINMNKIKLKSNNKKVMLYIE